MAKPNNRGQQHQMQDITFNPNPAPYGNNPQSQQIQFQSHPPQQQQQQQPQQQRQPKAKSSKREQYVNQSMNNDNTGNFDDNGNNYGNDQMGNQWENNPNANNYDNNNYGGNNDMNQMNQMNQMNNMSKMNMNQNNNNNFNNYDNGNNMGGNNMVDYGYSTALECDNVGSATQDTQNIIRKAIQSVLSGPQTTNPESISAALRQAGFMAILFNGGHGFWWNFECEWSEWSWDGESYRIIVWKPSQNNL